ncbi:MAG: ABC transporter permease [Verrucomicrobiales bacterium]
MRKFFVLYDRELKSFFHSPIAYVVMFCFLFLSGLSFWFAVQAMNGKMVTVSLLQVFFQFVMWFGFVLVFPLLTMRLFSEEFKLGTIEPLMTAPVSDWAIVLSKYFASLTFYAVLWAPTALYFWIYREVSGEAVVSSSETYWAAYLLVLLLGMAYLSIGLLASALSANQVVAAVLAFSVISGVFYLGLLGGLVLDASPYVRDLLAYVSAPEHMNMFLRGIIDTRAMVYYLTITIFALFLTREVLQYRRWKA